MTDPDQLDAITAAWTAQTEWMRENGVIQASWSAAGELLACALGPKPPTVSTDRPHRPSPIEREMEKRRVTLAAGSQLVKKIDP